MNDSIEGGSDRKVFKYFVSARLYCRQASHPKLLAIHMAVGKCTFHLIN